MIWEIEPLLEQSKRLNEANLEMIELVKKFGENLQSDGNGIINFLKSKRRKNNDSCG